MESPSFVVILLTDLSKKTFALIPSLAVTFTQWATLLRSIPGIYMNITPDICTEAYFEPLGGGRDNTFTAKPNSPCIKLLGLYLFRHLRHCLPPRISKKYGPRLFSGYSQLTCIQCSPPIKLFEYKECLHIVYGLQVPIPAYVFVMKFLSI